MSVIATIVKAGWIATPSQVEALATAVAQGVQADGTYLRVLLVECQAELNKRKRKGAMATQKNVVNIAHEKFYPCVQIGVGPEDISPKERTRRSTFARTSVHALRKYVAQGGDLRVLIPAETSKAKLRQFGQPIPTGTRIERMMQRATSAMERAAKRLAKGDPAVATERLYSAITMMQALLVEIEVPAPTKRAPRRQVATASASHRAH